MEAEGSLPRFKNLPLVPILSQLNPVHIVTSCFFNIQFCIILHPDLPTGIFPTYFATEILHALLISPIRDTCPLPTHLPLFIQPNNIRFWIKEWQEVCLTFTQSEWPTSLYSFLSPLSFPISFFILSVSSFLVNNSLLL
jgi:hypothetical protein